MPDKHARTTGKAREKLSAAVVKAYAAGHSIRDIAAANDMSYGKTHRILTEAGVQLRTRGGNHR